DLPGVDRLGPQRGRDEHVRVALREDSVMPGDLGPRGNDWGVAHACSSAWPPGGGAARPSARTTATAWSIDSCIRSSRPVYCAWSTRTAPMTSMSDTGGACAAGLSVLRRMPLWTSSRM